MRKRVVERAFLALTSSLLLAANVHSQEVNWYAEGLRAEFAGDYQAAIRNYTEAADEGISDAGFALGRTYRALGDDAESLKWFLISARAGNQFSAYELGLAYLDGTGAVVPDRAEALEWLIVAADKGHGEAAYQVFTLTGDADYLVQAGKQGVPAAYRDLASAYETGLYGLSVNSAESKKWRQAHLDTLAEGEDQ